MTTIGDYAFADCNALKEIVINNESLLQNASNQNYGFVIFFATTIKVPQGAICSSYITSSFTKQGTETINGASFDVYIKN